MTVSIREILAETLVGGERPPLPWPEVAAHIRREYIGDATSSTSNADSERRARHRKRNDLYNDSGEEHTRRDIEARFSDKEIRRLRLGWAGMAQFNNLVKRIVNELSTVYQEPPERRVDGDENNARYQDVIRACKQSVRFRHFNRMLNLHRAVLVGFRVRNEGTQSAPSLMPVIDVVTPDRAFVIAHPNDQSVLVAVGIEVTTKYARTSTVNPRWVVWTEHERFHLSDSGNVIESSIVEHGIGLLPWVLVSLDESGGLWPGRAGEDLVAAQSALNFINTCLLKETKSATKVMAFQGDTSRMAAEQALDIEFGLALPSGVVSTVMDLSMDLSMFRSTEDYIVDVTANNYGMSGALIRHQGVQSAEARDAMRIPLREMRLEQHVVLRPFEWQFARIQSAVLVKDLPDMAFSIDGWRIDFADPQTPRSIAEELADFEKARSLWLDSTVRYVMRRNPDLDREQAWTEVAAVIDEERIRQEMTLPIQIMSGALGVNTPTAATVPPTATGVMSVDGSNGRAATASPAIGREGMIV